MLENSQVAVSLYSDAATMPQATAAASRLVVLNRRNVINQHEITVNTSDAQLQQRMLMAEIERCLEEKAQLVIVGPENFWGDGSLPNLIAVAGEGANLCVAAPFPRVRRDWFLQYLQEGETLDNAALVKRAMAMLHPSWRSADNALPETSSYLAGITIARIAEGLYGVNHLLPSVFLARFTQDDLIFFREAIGRSMVGVFDHHWPLLLVKQGRQRVIGSSDAFFLVETTGAETHNVPLTVNDRSQPHRYHRDAPHIAANRNHVAIWRAG